MNAVLKRKVLYVQAQFESPVNVSSGENEVTDSDVLRDCNGTPFITGSSLAGAMRAYIEKEKSEPCLLGYSDGDAGKMSSLFISDLTFEENPVIGVRDGVSLSDKKTAVTQSKYDIEILEAGVKAHFYLELVIRENDDEMMMDQELATIFCGINAGEIRLGAKKTRGFGEFKIVRLSEKVYSKENYLEYADSYNLEKWENCNNELESWIKKASWSPKVIHVDVPLRMKGGISIRRYAAKKGEPDYVHLTDHGVPVIPGSSLAGAMHHRIKTILNELVQDGIELPKDIGDIMNLSFGYVKDTQACASNIIISEAEIEGAKPMTMIRTGVSRFESGVKDGALYKERTYVDGKVNLRLQIRRSADPEEEKWILGILLLALKDLQNGYLAVGGQTAIGRGVFSENGPLLIDGEAGREEEMIAEILTNMAVNRGIEG